MTTLHERFWRHVAKRGSDECWHWTACVHPNGYGRLGVGDGKFAYAHRVSWELHFTNIPSGMCVLHRCDNRLCVNPQHLFLGTKADNTADMMQKGRQRPGGYSKPVPLTATDIRQIRALRASGFTCVEIARQYRVTGSCVSKIIAGQRWKHLRANDGN